MKRWKYVNECLITGLQDICMTITIEDVKDGWEFPIAEIREKIDELDKVIITFYGFLSIQDIKNKVFVDFVNSISQMYVDSYEIYDEDTDEVLTVSLTTFKKLLSDNGINNIDIIE